MLLKAGAASTLSCCWDDRDNGHLAHVHTYAKVHDCIIWNGAISEEGSKSLVFCHET